MKKRAVLILAAVLCIIAGLAVFFSKNHVKNTDVLLNNNIDIIKVELSEQLVDDYQNYWNADNHNFAKGDGGSVGYGKCFGGNLLFCAGKRFI